MVRSSSLGHSPWGREGNPHKSLDQVSFYGALSLATSHRGLSLIEVLIVVTLITVMMVMSLPMLSNASDRARSELCQQNLVQIGKSIAGYTNDMNRLPTLHMVEPAETGLTLPEFVKPRLQAPHVVFCPSDETELSQTLGTSYQWSGTFNGLEPAQLDAKVGQVLLADREAFHIGPDIVANELTLQKDESGFRFTLAGTAAPANDSGIDEEGLALGSRKDRRGHTHEDSRGDHQPVRHPGG